MFKALTNKHFIEYELTTDHGTTRSKMPTSVALEILNRSTVTHDDGYYKTGRMSFSDKDFEDA